MSIKKLKILGGANVLAIILAIITAIIVDYFPENIKDLLINDS